MTFTSAASSSRPAWRALIADDDDDMRTLMTNALRRAGFEVCESGNGDELLASFAESTMCTLVVSDIGMPKCDGIKATLALKKLSPLTPVLLVTAFGDPQILASARDAGADAVLNKPLNFDTLVQTALALISRAPT